MKVQPDNLLCQPLRSLVIRIYTQTHVLAVRLARVMDLAAFLQVMGHAQGVRQTVARLAPALKRTTAAIPRVAKYMAKRRAVVAPAAQQLMLILVEIQTSVPQIAPVLTAVTAALAYHRQGRMYFALVRAVPPVIGCLLASVARNPEGPGVALDILIIRIL